MNKTSSAVVSSLIKWRAVSMARRMWGSVKGWRDDRKEDPNPTKRNLRIIAQICREHPDFGDKLRSRT